MQPYIRKENNTFAVFVQLLTVLFFIACLGIKLEEYDEARKALGLSGHEWAMVMLILTAMVMLLVAAFIVHDARNGNRVGVVRLAYGISPYLITTPTKRFHVFLSNTWSSGQDQVATIKRQLQLLLPGVSVFLDVDDLDEIKCSPSSEPWNVALNTAVLTIL